MTKKQDHSGAAVMDAVGTEALVERLGQSSDQIGDGNAGAVTEDTAPVLLVRGGRGKSGGSFFLDHAIQRARHAGRQVKPLDADKRSETLIRAYGQPADLKDSRPIDPQWATAPTSEDPIVVRDWLMQELDLMAEDRISRVIDFNGGDRVISDVHRDLDLGPFCQAIGVKLVSVLTLGPEVEDFRHMVKAAHAGHLEPHQIVLAFNEGVIPMGVTTLGAFEPILAAPELEELVAMGAEMMVMPRLACVKGLKEAGLSLYQAAYPAQGTRVSATLLHMTRQWLQKQEKAIVEKGIAEKLP
ncbi:hypothetical protein ACFQY5_40035 [Paeniroseomonas aquatica]|uniref:CobQ/CobB/MinD/ParA nucleotide binding domain-containing protein n=1 Tax=Paeniroseomonas aquatica TaxID=373043 RepID=A0ABT8A0P7_9PROT|nr:hypothetical protein [Paeniroseomonas aquatica]MDN3563114.1 hypothetical protein [Paeniroseomonas aquatica]